VRKIAKNLEKFGKNAKNVCEIAKNSIVLVNFVCVLGTFYRKEKSSQKSLILAGAGMRFAQER
jgi:hypothetical protein